MQCTKGKQTVAKRGVSVQLLTTKYDWFECKCNVQGVSEFEQLQNMTKGDGRRVE